MSASQNARTRTGRGSSSRCERHGSSQGPPITQAPARVHRIRWRETRRGELEPMAKHVLAVDIGPRECSVRRVGRHLIHRSGNPSHRPPQAEGVLTYDESRAVGLLPRDRPDGRNERAAVVLMPPDGLAAVAVVQRAPSSRLLSVLNSHWRTAASWQPKAMAISSRPPEQGDTKVGTHRHAALRAIEAPRAA